VDVVVRGEGEITLLELAQSLEKGEGLRNIKGISFRSDGGLIHNPDRSFLNLNQLPSTPWDLVDVEQYIHRGVLVKGSRRELDIGETSRGCPFACKFCYSKIYHRCQWRCMSPERVLEKIVGEVKKFDLDVVWIRDDNFFVDFNRVEGIARGIIEEDLGIKWYTSGIRVDQFNKLNSKQLDLIRKSGCDSLRFGVESGSDKILNFIGKGFTCVDVLKANRRCRTNGFIPNYSFMCGFPGETVGDINETVRLALKLKEENPDAVIHPVHVYAPYPGTELFNLCVEKGFQPPVDLRGWSEVDWMSKNRKLLPYLSDEVSELANTVSDVSYLTSDVVWMVLPFHLRILLYPMLSLENYRWKHQIFSNSYELDVLRLARNIVLRRLRTKPRSSRPIKINCH